MRVGLEESHHCPASQLPQGGLLVSLGEAGIFPHMEVERLLPLANKNH